MAVEVFKSQMTVLTAGHVCDSEPDASLVKEFSNNSRIRLQK